MRLLATIDDPLIIDPILVHLGLPADRVRADPVHEHHLIRRRP
jgi:hypothetical protein